MRTIFLRLLALPFAAVLLFASCSKERACKNCNEDKASVAGQAMGTASPVTGCNTNRTKVNARLVSVGTLSEKRHVITVASAGNKILFAGGFNFPDKNSSRVDIFDVVTRKWSTAELSVARRQISVVTAGNKIFFAGGETGDGTWPVNTVDIYDASTNTWSTSALSMPGYDMAAATVGNKVFFAGGDGGFTGGWLRSRRIDIYDLTTKTWSIASLSKANRLPTAVTAKNKIYFAGGEAWTSDPTYDPNATWYPSNRIDIYDNTTNTWSTSTLSEGKMGHTAFSAGDKIYWAGGATGTDFTPSCAVEIRDVNTGNSSLQYLLGPAPGKAVIRNSKIIFYRPYGEHRNKFDIYNITNNTWSIGVLPTYIEGASIISVNNIVYIAGGSVNGVLSNQVWRLEF